MDVASLVVADTEASNLIEPSKCPLDDRVVCRNSIDGGTRPAVVELEQAAEALATFGPVSITVVVWAASSLPRPWFVG